jgi:steroid 5-alpha reductase family enzyme
MDFLFWALLISMVINLALFLPAYFLKTDKITDLSYSATFIILSIIGFVLSTKSPAQIAGLVMIMLWALRLGGFLFIRVNIVGKDSRFDEMRPKFWSFLRFWAFQGLTVFIVLSPMLAFWQVTSALTGVISYLGWFIFSLGLALEATADYQKLAFNLKKKRKTWIDNGVWRFSRHPNYLGEIMVWTGVYLFCFDALSGIARILTLASPLYITVILLFFSGLPLLEKSADRRWGRIKAYQAYKKDVPVLLPTIKSLLR